MRENPDYNDIYYQNTTIHSQIIDIVTEHAVPLGEFPVPIDWKAFFGNSHPVEIEIGFGKGRFLLEASKRHPGVNYIGVERAQKYVALTQERFKKYMRHFGVDRTSGTFSNVRLAWTDANYFLMRYVHHRIRSSISYLLSRSVAQEAAAETTDFSESRLSVCPDAHTQPR